MLDWLRHISTTSLVVRPTRLFDLRKKDWNVTKTLGQWYYGLPAGDATQLGSSGSQSSTQVGKRNEAEECMLVTKLDYSEDYLQLQDMKYVHSDVQ
ncbi:uncharacterized protein BO95DRAFT_510552 [Aspergillus brunneoviolaceus CBS 621.78]|uniref:Uncharacterized protein n=1 Tax=Aspergillus brunneoviolaceus CBS 621.78 TaxID=1450534 RepID=A0ACD1GMI9_9EURO|nr:hypothetical protein BO95DRAFT_510552 [Aspergillus brunneoviolaceus CBS 621.78]RAH50457.1 hypothetical protein BO95DRAFT_510552 [Aspergillus brunneoviolaceus CBS 621.78]